MKNDSVEQIVRIKQNVASVPVMQHSVVLFDPCIATASSRFSPRCWNIQTFSVSLPVTKYVST